MPGWRAVEGSASNHEGQRGKPREATPIIFPEANPILNPKVIFGGFPRKKCSFLKNKNGKG